MKSYSEIRDMLLQRQFSMAAKAEVNDLRYESWYGPCGVVVAVAKLGGGEEKVLGLFRENSEEEFLAVAAPKAVCHAIERGVLKYHDLGKQITITAIIQGAVENANAYMESKPEEGLILESKGLFFMARLDDK